MSIKSNFDRLHDLKRSGASGFSFCCPHCNAGSEYLVPHPVGVSFKPYVLVETSNGKPQFINFPQESKVLIEKAETGSLLPQRNRDLENNFCGGKNIGFMYDSLPSIREALLKTSKELVSMECVECNFFFSLPNDTSNEEFSKYVKRRFPEAFVI